MDYTQLFRSLREARGFTLEQLALLARVHRNTVANIESGRQVRFGTLAALMRKMGYNEQSSELRAMAMLWLEAVSGIPFSRPDVQADAERGVTSARAGARDLGARLQALLSQAQLSCSDADTLAYLIEHPALLSLVATMRDLAQELAASEKPARLLQAAEDKAPYRSRRKRRQP